MSGTGFSGLCYLSALNERCDPKAQVPETERIGNILRGDCVKTMRPMHSGSVDFILTDPPYLVRYRSRCGRSIVNDVRRSGLRKATATARYM
jgi:predicted methyltransferase